jgi:hypothetical protein
LNHESKENTSSLSASNIWRAPSRTVSEQSSREVYSGENSEDHPAVLRPYIVQTRRARLHRQIRERQVPGYRSRLFPKWRDRCTSASIPRLALSADLVSAIGAACMSRRTAFSLLLPLAHFSPLSFSTAFSDTLCFKLNPTGRTGTHYLPAFFSPLRIRPPLVAPTRTYRLYIHSACRLYFPTTCRQPLAPSTDIILHLGPARYLGFRSSYRKSLVGKLH